jgi:glycogen phosphorylase
VQLVHGPAGAADELVDTSIDRMELAGRNGEGLTHYKGEFACGHTGRYGFTVRVLPAHPDLATPVELGRIAWA